MDFTLGTLASKGGGRHSVACIQALKQGNQAVMPVYQALAEEFQPTLIVLLGIGGIIHQDLDLCDVCVADSVLNYDARAETPNGVKRTFDPLPPIEQWLLKIYRRLEKKHGEEMKFQACEDSRSPEFKVRIGPIGSGGAVVRNEDCDIRDWLKTVSRKTTSLETEASGVAQQYQSNQLRHNLQTKGYLVVRGGSDLANKDKNKTYRYQPAMNSMIFLAHFLADTMKNFEGDLPHRI